jgi:hypothetical protein
MPYKEQGIADVVADEKRGLIYVVTCEDQHWMVHDGATRRFRELGPMLTPYATTLVDAAGGACVVTKDFQLARFDPASGKVQVRDIHIDGKVFCRPNGSAIPTWDLAADGRTAYLILMNDATLFEIDLASKGDVVTGKNRGKMLEGKSPDSRSALSIAPDGRVYAMIRVDNTTKYGGGYLHHLVRYDPKKGTHQDLGVVTVKNPDFFPFAKPGGKAPPWSHGYHRLPDGTMTPLHHHMALIVGREGTIYATILYPFTLLKIDAASLPR